MNKLESLIALKKHILNMKYMFSDKQEKDNVIEHNFIKGIKYEDINLYMLDKQIEEEQKKEFERRVNQEVQERLKKLEIDIEEQVTKEVSKMFKV